MEKKSISIKTSKKKEYVIEKHDSYNSEDYKDIINHFNEKLSEFVEEIIKICIEKRWRKEADDIGQQNELFLLGIKLNKLLAVEHFSTKIYPLYNFIKLRKEDVLLNHNYAGMTGNTSDGLSKIMNAKKLWLESGIDNKEYIFQTLEYLCYCIEHYEEVGLTTGYVKKPIGVIPIK